MRVQRLLRHAGAVGIAAAAVMLGCGPDPVGPQAEDIYIEVHVTGGFAAVDYIYAVVGSSSDVRGIACERACDFEPGDVLADLARWDGLRRPVLRSILLRGRVSRGRTRVDREGRHRKPAGRSVAGDR
jgi:hypothetical protein